MECIAPYKDITITITITVAVVVVVVTIITSIIIN